MNIKIVLPIFLISIFTYTQTAYNTKSWFSETIINPIQNCFGNIYDKTEKESKRIAIELLAMTFPLPKEKPQSGLDKWISPNPKLRYNEVCFLCTHNSHSTIEDEYYPYAQQYFTLKKQLKLGARGLMLDIYNEKGKVVLSHGKPKIAKFLRPYSFLRKHPLMTFPQSLKIIKNFLEKYPTEIITICLEDHVKSAKKINQSIKAADIKHLVLTPSNWNPNKEKGWPTIEWMQQNNKRLIIFGGKGKYIFHPWKNYAENPYDTFNIKKALTELERSKKGALANKGPRYLYLINFFKDPLSDLKKINVKNVFTKISKAHKKLFNTPYYKYNTKILRHLVKRYAFIKGLGPKGNYKGRYPNFIFLDYFHEGNAMALVNEINHKSESTQNRAETIFAPLVYNE